MVKEIIGYLENINNYFNNINTVAINYLIHAFIYVDSV